MTPPPQQPLDEATVEAVAIDAPMLGRFVMQYEEGAHGFFVDADEVQEVARQVKAALGLGEAVMAEVHNDPDIPTDVAIKVYAAIKRAAIASLPSATVGEKRPDQPK